MSAVPDQFVIYTDLDGCLLDRETRGLAREILERRLRREPGPHPKETITHL